MNDTTMTYTTAKQYVLAAKQSGKIGTIEELAQAAYVVGNDYASHRITTANRESCLADAIRLISDNLFNQDYDKKTGQLKVQGTTETKALPEFDRALIAIGQGIVDAYGSKGNPTDGLKYANKVMKQRFTAKPDEDMTKASAGYGATYYPVFRWGNDALTFDIKQQSDTDKARKAVNQALALFFKSPDKDAIVSTMAAMVNFSSVVAADNIAEAKKLEGIQDALSSWVENTSKLADTDQGLLASIIEQATQGDSPQDQEVEEVTADNVVLHRTGTNK